MIAGILRFIFFNRFTRWALKADRRRLDPTSIYFSPSRYWAQPWGDNGKVSLND